jgi:hypothetical protein
MIFLPLPSKCWDYKCALPCMAPFIFLESKTLETKVVKRFVPNGKNHPVLTPMYIHHSKSTERQERCPSVGKWGHLWPCERVRVKRELDLPSPMSSGKSVSEKRLDVCWIFWWKWIPFQTIHACLRMSLYNPAVHVPQSLAGYSKMYYLNPWEHKFHKFVPYSYGGQVSLRSRLQLIWFLVRALFLACRWLHMVKRKRNELSCVSYYKDTNCIGSGPHPDDLN